MIPRRALAVLILFVAMLAPAAGAGVKSLNAVKGAQVWFAEDHTVPMIALVASFPAGSAYDPSTKAGMASFATALLDEGAGNLDSQGFQTALADHAIQLSAQADRDSMTVTLYALSSDAKEAFRLLGLALVAPALRCGRRNAGAPADALGHRRGQRRSGDRSPTKVFSVFISARTLMVTRRKATPARSHPSRRLSSNPLPASIGCAAG